MNKNSVKNKFTWIEKVDEIQFKSLPVDFVDYVKQYAIKKVQIEVIPISTEDEMLNLIPERKKSLIKQVQSLNDELLIGFYKSKGSIKKLNIKN
ncbi:MAG: hypothetical protein IPM56_11865 [Ignavibacteriales bacterium]|nr:MAG: hypothetical protein IPM56_11865 [Ignavibacteriales bacterium]